MRCISVFCMMVLGLATLSTAATVGYWQLDGASDNLDAMLAHGPDDYLDLTLFGTVNPASAAVDPVPNAAAGSFRWQAGDGDPAANEAGQAFGGGAGWYLDPSDAQLYFDNDSSFTAECWFRTSATNGYIMGNRHADSYLKTSGWFTGWQLWATFGGQKLSLYAEGNASLAQGGQTSEVLLETTITPNTWYHAAVVWDHDDGANGTLRLYLDGTEVASAAGDAAWSGVTGGSWAIGQRNLWVDESDLGLGTVWGQTGYSGSIDEVRFVDEVLTPAQFLNGSTPYAPAADVVLDGDLDLDGDVDLADFAEFVTQWQLNTDPSQPDAVQL